MTFIAALRYDRISAPWVIDTSWARRICAALDKDAPLSRTVKRAGGILCRPVLGGLHHEYVRI
jgi:hypothetical protein